MEDDYKTLLSRREFLKTAGLTALATDVSGALTLPLTACAKSEDKANKVSDGPYTMDGINSIAISHPLSTMCQRR